MSYVENHLLAGERVVHSAHLHKLTYFGHGVLSVLAFVFGGLMLYYAEQPWIGAAILVAGAIPIGIAWIDYASSEFAVTDKRVVIKVGFIQRRTLETMLGKVEGIGVDQSVLGRLLNYGTITVTGTGGTQERFTNIAHPLEFRRQVQGQIAEGDVARQLTGMPVVAGTPMVGGAPRDERDCPHCAERILARAKVCKHCGHEVEPVAAGDA